MREEFADAGEDALEESGQVLSESKFQCNSINLWVRNEMNPPHREQLSPVMLDLIPFVSMLRLISEAITHNSVEQWKLSHLTKRVDGFGQR